ncbi:MAG: hypothetical protein CO140_01200 [Candidatus Moranbacteria bacterium CG_4_9_14_3_um_filter_40_7]|nr:MAG: hypothetical protein CO140_01200 [Candidatus Moranbacteria bacterium CG_4_9_14_3_um_filter_40_7]
MRKEKDLAIKLRKTGKSYGQISKQLTVPKSTLSYWLSNMELSEKNKEKIYLRAKRKSCEILIRINKNQTHLALERAKKIRKEAQLEVFKLAKNRLFLVGASLYWAEGYKKGAAGSKWKGVDFANSDPELIKIMMDFFRKICQVSDEKIKMQIMLHSNNNISKSIDYWSELTKIKKGNFIKTFVFPKKISHKKKKIENLTHGTVHIRINDVKLFFRIIGWIDGLKSNI